MMKKILLLVLFISTSTAFSQIAIIDAAPITLEQGEVFTMTASFDAGTGDSIDGNLTFLLRLYDTSDETFTWVAAENSNQNGVNSASGVVSPNITVPSGVTPTADLTAGFEYRLVASYKRAVAADFISIAQIVTITQAVVPTITQSIITTAEILVDANGKATGWVPSPAISITLTNFAANTSYTVFNQFKITNSSGAQWGGGSIAIMTDATGFGQNTSWNPGFFGSNGDFTGTETVGFWNSNTIGPSGAVATNQTFPITQTSTTLSTKSIELNTVGVYPNPTSNFLTIESKSEFNSVVIYNLIGKQVKSFKNTNKLNVSDLATGIYLLKTDTGLLSKFVKE